MVAVLPHVADTNVDELREKGEKLFEAHWREVANMGHALAVNWVQYYALEEAGKLFTLAAWRGETLIGYSVNIMSPSLDCADQKIASNTALYVAPAHRRRRVGHDLMKRTEERAKRYGAHVMTWHAKPHTTLESILPRMGYYENETIYSKEL